MPSYVYKITNLVNGKIYIGKTSKTIEYRFRRHIRAAKVKDPKDYSAIHKAINKHGYENFKVELVEEFSTDEECLEAERKYISQFNSIDKKIGYNISLGGDGPSGAKHTEEAKIKMSRFRKGRFVGEANHFYGKTHSTETKKKIGDKRKGKYTGIENPFFGKTHSEETVKYLTEINTGANHPKAKLTEEDVLYIRANYKPGVFGSRKALAQKYGIKPRYVHSIYTRKTWKHI